MLRDGCRSCPVLEGAEGCSRLKGPTFNFEDISGLGAVGAFEALNAKLNLFDCGPDGGLVGGGMASLPIACLPASSACESSGVSAGCSCDIVGAD